MSKSNLSKNKNKGASASRSRSIQKVLDSERRFIDDSSGVMYVTAIIILVLAVSSASGQMGAPPKTDAEQEVVTTTWIHLVGGHRTQVDDVSETADGFWYKRANLMTFIDRARVERIERSSDPRLLSLSETFEGTRKWSIADSPKVESFFVSRFNRPLPLTAFGQSELHNRWGLDHRQSMDVGVHPDSVEGKALIRFLIGEGIPFLAFRSSVPGVATGPHIHIGHGSSRIRK